jgi:hypothetical protein
MRKHLAAALLLLACSLAAQTEKPTAPLSTQDIKGAQPINQKPSNQKPSNQTRAVVVGISDYHDPGIPDLRFADRDAAAFANFLRSPAGGALDGDHLKVLTRKFSLEGVQWGGGRGAKN